MKPEQSWLLKDTNPLLRRKAELLSIPVSNHDQTYIDKMVAYIDACYEHKAKEYDIRSGIALAGPQVGLAKQVIYLRFKVNKEEKRYLIANPRIMAESVLNAYVGVGEGCLSVDEEWKGIVKRRNRIIVKAYDILHKKDITIDAEGLLAICLQHEIDHLSGILYYDRINKNQPFTIEKDWIKY